MTDTKQIASAFTCKSGGCRCNPCTCKNCSC
jgi:hypothetical protein